MGDLSEFSVSVRAFLRAYPWRRIDPVPWQELRKPVAESRLAIVSSAGLIEQGQEPFDPKLRGGDFTYRRISSQASVNNLIDTHRSKSYDHTGMHEDPNLVLPLDRIRELRDQGRIGSLASHHLSFMGSITAPGRLIHRTAPEAAAELARDEVDLAILIPV